jgi:REP element-mobilizing transposase RayT
MPRELRIQYPGAICHILNSGDQRDDIFFDDEDRLKFLGTLEQCCRKTDWEVHAYCPTRNHYHLVFETPRQETTMSLKWIARRLDMGSWTYVSNLRHAAPQAGSFSPAATPAVSIMRTDTDWSNIQSLLVLAFLIAVAAVFSGCGRTYVGGSENSPDRKYSLGVCTDGAYNRAYWEDTMKTVSVTIYTNDGSWTELFAEGYRVRGSDLRWTCAWDKRDNLTVTLHDYGLGVSHYDLKEGSPPRRTLRSLRYELNAKTGRFQEQKEQ